MLKFRSVLFALLTAGLPTGAYAMHTTGSGLGTGTARALNTDSAVPLVPGRWSAGVRLDYLRFDRLSEAELIALREADAEADLHSAKSLFSTTLNVSYGVTESFTAGIKLPYVRRNDIVEPGRHHGEELHSDIEGDHGSDDAHHDEGLVSFTPAHAGEDHGVDADDDHAEDAGEPPAIELLGDASGVGDASAYGQWRFFHDPDADAHAALLFGLKIPTGSTSEKTREGADFELEFQPGSGSWDPFAGAAFSRTFDDFGVDASILYTLVTEGKQDTELGDKLFYNLAASRRLVRNSGLAWDLIVELNGEWQDEQKVAGRINRNSGGHVLYLSPGVALRTANWTLAAGIGVPIVDEPNGDQDGRDYRVTTTIVYSPQP